jgi:hypothetical protein
LKYLWKIIWFSIQIAFVLFGPASKNVGPNEPKFSFDIYYMIMLVPKKPPKEENEPTKIVIISTSLFFNLVGSVFFKYFF